MISFNTFCFGREGKCKILAVENARFKNAVVGYGSLVEDLRRLRTNFIILGKGRGCSTKFCIF